MAEKNNGRLGKILSMTARDISALQKNGASADTAAHPGATQADEPAVRTIDPGQAGEFDSYDHSG